MKNDKNNIQSKRIVSQEQTRVTLQRIHGPKNMIYDEIFGEIRVMDGGLGSLLSQMGHPIEDDNLWSARVLIENPKDVVHAHKQFLYSGATIIETCSYQAGLANLQEQLKISLGESKIYLKNSVALAQEAVADFTRDQNPGYKIYIAGSIGSYGSNLHDRSEYTGSYISNVDPIMLREYYEGQADVLMEAGVDILVFETIPTLDDALIIAQLMGSPKFKDFPFWISFYCKDNYSLGSNESLVEVMKSMSKLDNVKVVGINCTDPRFIESLLKCDPIQKISVVNPNRFNIDQKIDFADLIPRWLAHGVKVFGGCCYVTPKDIADIASVLKLRHDCIA